ncbi:S46 family peptidase [Membranihabitans maritimus]|uniref:S46 family peptidase n=1 Tax=Membranihabitans maritimus TaxID=2904244 RepID=UPI001F29D9DD|nr:S46 family peptidase [Membranihabitans maritimus]
MKEMKLSLTALTLIFVVFNVPILAQDEPEFSEFDFGRMWTFEDAPLNYFNETYDLELDQAWMDKMRKSALRFSTFCSASFISGKGLIMTNHHCSRGVATNLQRENENFEEDGFYANTQMEERKAEGLFVDQLIQAQDVTDKMKGLLKDNDAAEAEEMLKSEYEENEKWSDLRLQLVTYYSGGRYAMYGYKRYSDIRLVLIPENALGFFGGDPDNFTYPRYNLDFTFWRAYDEKGQPLNTSANFFPVNPDGVEEGTPVFVIGNPGNTERYRTMTQLKYDREVRIPAVLTFIKSAVEVLRSQYEENNDPRVMNSIFSLENGRKAYTGILEGLQNEEYMTRKKAAEDEIRDAVRSDFQNQDDPWDKLDIIYSEVEEYGAFSTLLNPSPYRGSITGLLHKLYDFLDDKTADSNKMALKDEILSMTPIDESQEMYLNVLVRDFNAFSDENVTPTDIGKIFSSTLFSDSAKVEEWLNSDDPETSDDPLIMLANQMIPEYKKAVELNQKYGKEIAAQNEAIANAAFRVFGDQLPPDATFTLRISDGVVKGFKYNGTVAPINTTYFGLYDRYYSHKKEFPWDLPDKWLNPTMDLLKTPLNFVSTNDIIGGNSGSAIINSKGEAVGLIFDGNIESLPGNFIFDETENRSVSVHAGGIVGALIHIYKADRIVNEILN